MIVKEPDNTRGDIAALQAMIQRPELGIGVKTRMAEEIRRIQARIRSREEAAYEIAQCFGRDPNWMVLHDLRLQVDGVISQIDHVLIDRLLDIWVCESKYFYDGVAIDDVGRFSVFWSGRPCAIPSPLERNRRHIQALQAAIRAGLIDLPAGAKPQWKSLVVVPRQARIARPDAQLQDLDTVITGDMLPAAIRSSWQPDNGDPALLDRVVTQSALGAVAHSIMALHAPADIDWRERFGLEALPEATTQV